MNHPEHSAFEYPIIAKPYPIGTIIKQNENGTIKLLPPIEISITKDMESKMKLALSKTSNTRPDINHWYAKVVILNRKRYVIAANTKTRFALLFKLNPKTFIQDFKLALRFELEKYEMEIDSLEDLNVILSLGNNRASTAQLSRVGQEIEYILQYKDFASYDGDYADLFGDYNKSNLGLAGDNKDMTFAAEEMCRILSESN